jgi:hypothetical protein
VISANFCSPAARQSIKSIQIAHRQHTLKLLCSGCISYCHMQKTLKEHKPHTCKTALRLLSGSDRHCALPCNTRSRRSCPLRHSPETHFEFSEKAPKPSRNRMLLSHSAATLKFRFQHCSQRGQYRHYGAIRPCFPAQDLHVQTSNADDTGIQGNPDHDGRSCKLGLTSPDLVTVCRFNFIIILYAPYDPSL